MSFNFTLQHYYMVLFNALSPSLNPSAKLCYKFKLFNFLFEIF